MHTKITFFVLLLLFLSNGCGDGPGPAEEAVVFKNKENTVFARLPAEPDRLNPVLTINTYANVVNGLMFHSLLAFDPATLKLEPQLARSRPAVDTAAGPGEGPSYTFEIFPEARWGNGEPVTGRDVAFTLKAIFNPQVGAGPIRSSLDFIRDIEIDPGNEKLFVVYTNRPYILAEESISNLVILPEYRYDPDGLLREFSLADLADTDSATRLAEQEDALRQFAEAFNAPRYSREPEAVGGSGAYRLEAWETGQRIVLTRKDNWWGDDLGSEVANLEARPEKVVFRIIPETVTAMSALKDEAIDVTAQIDAKDFSELRKNEVFNRRFSLHAPGSLIYYYIGLNTRHPLLDDRRVRRALAHLVDVDQVIDELFYGLAERTVGPVHPSKPYYHDGLALIQYDPDRARALLDEAGWTDRDGDGVLEKNIDGEEREMRLNYLVSAGSQFARNLSLLLQDNFRQAGIAMDIESQEFSVLIDNLRSRDFHLFGSGWVQSPVLDDPKQIWHTESDTPDGANRVGFGNARSDVLIDEIRVTLDEEERNRLYREFQEIVYEEQPYIFLFTPAERIAISKRFQAEPSVLRPGFFVNKFELRAE